MKNFLQASILKFTGWFSKNILDKLDNPFNHRYITSKDYRNLKQVMVPGTVLLSRTKGEITNMFIPGFFKHGAIVVSENEVVEAIGRGVVKRDLIDFMFSKDYVIAVHPTFATKDQMLMAANISSMQEGKPYDFDIVMSDINKFYCFELVFFSYAQSVKDMPFVPNEIMGRKTIISSDFINAPGMWKVVWMSDSFKDY